MIAGLKENLRNERAVGRSFEPVREGMRQLYYDGIVRMGFLQCEIRVVFPGESQLDRVALPNLLRMLGVFSVSIIHRTLTGTTGSLTCAQMLMRAIAQRGVRAHVVCES